MNRQSVRKFVAVLLGTLALLAGCGQGAEEQPKAWMTPPLRTSISGTTPSIVSIDESVLLDWAESTYSEYLPSHQQTLYWEEFAYRFYPQSGNYVGVWGDEVYVLGPTTGGERQFVGLMTDFACRIFACRDANTWTFVYSPDVTQAERQEMEQGFAKTRIAILGELGVEVPSLNAYLLADLTRLADIKDQKFPGWSREDFLLQHDGSMALSEFQYARDAQWLALSARTRYVYALAHTYGHLMHNTLAAGHYGDAPVWMHEGFATYIQFLSEVAVYGSSETEGSARNNSDSVVSLQSIETRAPMTAAGNSGYMLGYIAVKYLVDHAPEGKQSIVNFWRALGTGVGWQQAFQSAFHKSVDAFYAEFEAWRASTASPHVIGTIVDANGTARASYHVFGCLYHDGVGGPCQEGVEATTNAQGQFRLTVVKGRSYFLTVNNTLGGNEGFLGFYSAEVAPALTLDANKVTTLTSNGSDISGLVIVAP